MATGGAVDLGTETDPRRWLAVLWWAVIDSLSGGMASPSEVMEKWDDFFRWGSKNFPDRKSWGETEAAQHSVDVLEALADPAHTPPRKTPTVEPEGVPEVPSPT